VENLKSQEHNGPFVLKMDSPNPSFFVYVFLSLLFCFCGAREQTQGLKNARQVHWDIFPVILLIHLPYSGMLTDFKVFKFPCLDIFPNWKCSPPVWLNWKTQLRRQPWGSCVPPSSQALPWVVRTLSAYLKTAPTKAQSRNFCTPQLLPTQSRS
jgi:hypothetical protein